MGKPVKHKLRSRTNKYGGELTTSLCGRLRTLNDGMNLTDVDADVTCKFCLARLQKPRAA